MKTLTYSVTMRDGNPLLTVHATGFMTGETVPIAVELDDGDATSTSIRVQNGHGAVEVPLAAGVKRVFSGDLEAEEVGKSVDGSVGSADTEAGGAGESTTEPVVTAGGSTDD